MEAAWEAGCNDIFLEVRVSNRDALHLYRKLGYEVLSVRKNYYSDPVEDAYVMDCKKETYPWVRLVKDRLYVYTCSGNQLRRNFRCRY